MRHLIHLRTEHLGPEELLVGAKIDFDPTLSFAELAATIDAGRGRDPGRGAAPPGSSTSNPTWSGPASPPTTRPRDPRGEALPSLVMTVDDGVREQLQALGEFIRTQRQQAQMSLRDLAELTNVSNPYLSQIERGLHEPSMRVLKAISDALNVSIETLLARAGLSHRTRTPPPVRTPRASTPRPPSWPTRRSPTSSGPRCWPSTTATSIG